MLIGIDGSRAFLKNRTGIEEYSYQVIDGLKKYLQKEQVVLYIRSNQSSVISHQEFDIPENWKIKVINFPRFWTQLGLSLEMLLHPVDALFIPAHTVPIIHPKNTVVVIHGLEYEFCPASYSFWDRIYMRASIKNSCAWANKIISVSQNTKKDLIDLYKVSAEKISVIYEGYSSPLCHSERSEESRKIIDSEIKIGILRFTQDDKSPYLLFVGRIEERKNISNIIKAFEILKEKYAIPHKLVLAGKPGFGYEKVKSEKLKAKSKGDIVELGFVSEEEKWKLLKAADVFVFPTLYEGFGIPVLEAQSVGCPVVASNNSSVPEIVRSKSLLPLGEGLPEMLRITKQAGATIAIGADEGGEQSSALLVDPQSPEEIAESIYKLISDETLKNAIISRGLENVKRFSWEKCAKEIAEVLLK